jgi:hypothetical protein
MIARKSSNEITEINTDFLVVIDKTFRSVNPWLTAARLNRGAWGRA